MGLGPVTGGIVSGLVTVGVTVTVVVAVVLDVVDVPTSRASSVEMVGVVLLVVLAAVGVVAVSVVAESAGAGVMETVAGRSSSDAQPADNAMIVSATAT